MIAAVTPSAAEAELAKARNHPSPCTTQLTPKEEKMHASVAGSQDRKRRSSKDLPQKDENPSVTYIRKETYNSCVQQYYSKNVTKKKKKIAG